MIVFAVRVHGDDNKTNNTTFGSVALWHKNRAEWTGSPKGQSTRTALRLVGIVTPVLRFNLLHGLI